MTIPVIAGLLFVAIFFVCIMAALAFQRLNARREQARYTKEDAQELADRISDNKYLEPGEKEWYFQDNKHWFNFVVREETAYPPGLPPAQVLETDYYSRRLEDIIRQYDSILLFEIPPESRPTRSDKTTPAQFKSGQYECTCFSDEDVINAVNAINQAVKDICQEDRLDSLLVDGCQSITIIYKMDDKTYVDLLDKGNTDPEDVLACIRK